MCSKRAMILILITTISLLIPLIYPIVADTSNSYTPLSNSQIVNDQNPKKIISGCQDISSSITINNISIAKARRDVNPDIYGLLIVNDTFTIFNNRSSSLFYFVYYVPKNFTKFLNFISCFNSYEERLSILNVPSEYDNYTKYIILFDSPILPFENYTFKVVMVYVELITLLNTTDEQSFFIDYYLFPIVPYNISWMYTSVKLPLTATKLSIYPDFNGTADLFGHKRYNVLPMHYEKFNVSYTFTETPPVEYLKMEKTIRVVPTAGLLLVHEIHVVKNLGKVALNNLAVYIPNRSYDIQAVDAYGELTTYPHQVGRKIAVTTRFRVDIKQNTTYMFNVSYKVPIDEVVREDGISFILNVDVNPHIPILIREYKINVILPEGLSIVEFYLNLHKERAILTKNDNQIIMMAMNITHLYFDSLLIRYMVIGLPNYSRIFFFSVIIGFIAFIYVASRKFLPRYIVTKGAYLVEETIPVDLIREFTDLYDEKIGIILELEKLESDLAAGKVKKREYLSKKATLENELRNAIRKLEPVKEELRKVGRRYNEAVKKLEILEEERESAKASLDFLKRRYRLRKIRKSVYEKLSEEQMKKLRKATEEMDRIIFNLRQLIQ